MTNSISSLERPGEKCTPKRKGYRNGHYTRDLVTSTIVSEMREVRYIYDTHKSRDTLDYYFGGITFDEYEKMSGKQVNSIEEFLHM